jgi:DNA-binding response OmpR family regulator
MHILIAEDDAPVAKFLSGGLEAEHYDVRVASNGEMVMPMVQNA